LQALLATAKKRKIVVSEHNTKLNIVRKTRDVVTTQSQRAQAVRESGVSRTLEAQIVRRVRLHNRQKARARGRTTTVSRGQTARERRRSRPVTLPQVVPYNVLIADDEVDTAAIASGDDTVDDDDVPADEVVVPVRASARERKRADGVAAADDGQDELDSGDCTQNDESVSANDDD
jgi:hypothetical protein